MNQLAINTLQFQAVSGKTLKNIRLLGDGNTHTISEIYIDCKKIAILAQQIAGEIEDRSISNKKKKEGILLIKNSIQDIVTQFSVIKANEEYFEISGASAYSNLFVALRVLDNKIKNIEKKKPVKFSLNEHGNGQNFANEREAETNRQIFIVLTESNKSNHLMFE